MGEEGSLWNTLNKVYSTSLEAKLIENRVRNLKKEE